MNCKIYAPEGIFEMSNVNDDVPFLTSVSPKFRHGNETSKDEPGCTFAFELRP